MVTEAEADDDAPTIEELEFGFLTTLSSEMEDVFYTVARNHVKTSRKEAKAALKVHDECVRPPIARPVPSQSSAALSRALSALALARYKAWRRADGEPAAAVRRGGFGGESFSRASP